MGCHLSSQVDDDSKPSKVVNSSKESGGGDDPPPPPPTDPRLPLSRRQLFSITKSWKGISRQIEPTGIAMFIKLFEENRDILDLFEKFGNLKTMPEQKESIELQEHASSVMNTIHEAIGNLENVDGLMVYLDGVARIHDKVHGFNKDLFWKMEAPFLCAVKETLGDRYTENMEEIYKVTIHFLLKTLTDKYVAVKCENDRNAQNISYEINSADKIDDTCNRL